MIAIFTLRKEIKHIIYDTLVLMTYNLDSIVENIDNTEINNLLEEENSIFIKNKYYLKLPEGVSNLEIIYGTNQIVENEEFLFLDSINILNNMFCSLNSISKGNYQIGGSLLSDPNIHYSPNQFKKLLNKNFVLYKLS